MGPRSALNDVKNGSDTIADVAQEPTDADARLDFYPIAKYAICVVTNKANALANVTQAQLTAIFTGKTTSWSQIPGATATGPIEVFTRTAVAGVLTSFKALLLEGKSVAKRDRRGDRGPDAPVDRKRARRDRLRVQLSGRQRRRELRLVQRRGLQQGNRGRRQYAGVAVFYEVTKGTASGGAATFINWVDGSAAAKKIIASEWVPIGS